MNAPRAAGRSPIEDRVTDTRYQSEADAWSIEGYWFPTAQQTMGLNGGLEAAFAKAKEELLGHLHAKIQRVEAMDMDEFMRRTKRAPQSNRSAA